MKESAEEMEKGERRKGNEVGKNEEKERIMSALSETMHPEINKSLVDLGMIGEVVSGESVSIILLLPFLQVPIREMLISMVEDAVRRVSPSSKIVVEPKEMDDDARSRFMRLSQENWRF